MTYRTKTYIAAEWEGENDAIEQLKNGIIVIFGVYTLPMHTI